jgi:hypothetical protein
MSWLITPQQKNKLLLDDYPGAAGAYSFRNLTILSDAPVIRVRRSSDNAEADFRASEVSSGTLASWVGAGNNGFVRTWYDQSGNGLHLVQTTIANQPQIIANGVLNTEGGNPCIRHNSETNALTAPTSYTSSFHSVFKVARVTSTGANRRVLTIVSEQAVFRKNLNNAFEIYGAGMSITNSGSGAFPTTRVLLSGIWRHLDGDMFGYSNGVGVVSNTSGPGATAAPTAYTIGGVATEGFSGSVQEVIIYRSDQTSNRTTIEASINAHYAIY